MTTAIAIVVGIVLLGVIQGIIDSIRGNKGNEEEGVIELNPQEHGFRGRVRVDMETLDDGTEVEVLDIQIKGVILGEREHWTGVARVAVADVTESKDGAYPVLCAIDALQRPDTCIFEFASDPQSMGEVCYIEEWTTLFKVPTEALQFARRGRRKMCFYFGVTDTQGNPAPHTYDEVEFEYDSREPGYVDLDNIQREMDQLTVQLAVLVSAADGHLDKAEGEVVQHWIKKRLSVEEDADRMQEIKQGLNTAVREAGSFQGDPDRNVRTICQTIVQKGAHAHRYDAIELCLEVAGADGSAEREELAMIEGIARNLEIDAAKLKDMVQKALPVGMFADKDPDSVLGITPNMPKPEVRRLLNEEYRKWNSRVSHSDKKVREQAGEMLALIADARRRHIG